MNLFDIYPRFDVILEKARGCYVFDNKGTKYLDLYGGHAVISIGHSHPQYIDRIDRQLRQLAFYSNSVNLPIQDELADKLGKASGYPDYRLFLVNSGAEAVENAMKLASFRTGRKKFIVFENAFHGRTSLTVAATANQRIQAPCNPTDNIIRAAMNDLEAVEAAMNEDIAAILIEGMQGIAGIYEPDIDFLKNLERLTHKNGSLLILDEIQSGFGRSGKFFAHQYANIRPDIITTAKGMGNGFPIGGLIISPKIPAIHGQLGTTFGGNPLACAAALAVLEVIENENLITKAEQLGTSLIHSLEKIHGVKEVRGRGLMLGIELDQPAAPIRKKLLNEYQIFTGSATQSNTIRLLPPLTITESQLTELVKALTKVLEP